MLKLRDRSMKLVFIYVAVVILPCANPRKLTTKFCISVSNTIRARHKSCFLRPDTGPCRADIIQWYFDAKMDKCYRFYWGGCQGNGNKFETKEECLNHCWLNLKAPRIHRPRYCDLTFSYGTCFGHYERWYYDSTYKTCKRRIYSGCGGNQNSFETLSECNRNCVATPTKNLTDYEMFTTCVTLDLPNLLRKKRHVTLPYKF